MDHNNNPVNREKNRKQPIERKVYKTKNWLWNALDALMGEEERIVPWNRNDPTSPEEFTDLSQKLQNSNQGKKN